MLILAAEKARATTQTREKSGKKMEEKLRKDKIDA